MLPPPLVAQVILEISVMTPPQPPLTEAEIGNVLLTLLTYVGRDARLLERVICQLRRERDEAREALSNLQRRAGEIADDFHPDNDKQAPLALSEMRTAIADSARKAAST
jgi:hypothetical protein